MIKVYTLKCPECGAPLRKLDEECAYCKVGLFYEDEPPKEAPKDRRQLWHDVRSAVDRGEDYLFGMDSIEEIDQGVTAVVSVTPQKRLIPTRFHLGHQVGASFEILEIRVGSEVVLPRPVSGMAFVGFKAPLLRPSVTCEIGMAIAVTARSIVGNKQRFAATFESRTCPWIHTALEERFG